MKIQIFRSKKGNKQFYFRIRAINGQILCTSEGYTRRGNARKTAEAVRCVINPGTPIIEA